MTNAREVNIKGRISLISKEYSVLNEGIKNDECGWSQPLSFLSRQTLQKISILYILHTNH
jgi:hypothetical protein